MTLTRPQERPQAEKKCGNKGAFAIRQVYYKDVNRDPI